jgi:hypothetical protein
MNGEPELGRWIIGTWLVVLILLAALAGCAYVIIEGMAV